MEKKLNEILNSLKSEFNINSNELNDITNYKPYLEKEKNKQIIPRNSLIIKLLRIRGKKKDDNSIVNKTFEFYEGVNIISTNGNNLKGKTTLLEIIKYLLTGNNKYLPNFVKNMLIFYELKLEINNVDYVFLYEIEEAKFQINNLKTNEIFNYKLKEAQNILAEFFSFNFNYYNLKYSAAQKKSKSPRIANLRWYSYFSSIYLSSKEYNHLLSKNYIGGLNNKILQILFDFKFNEFLNELDLKLEKILERKNEKNLLQTERKKIKEDEKELVKSKAELQIAINKIKEKIIFNINEENNDIIKLNNNLLEKNEEIIDVENRKNTIKKEITKENKTLIKLKDGEAIIKALPLYMSCPVCFKDVKLSKKKESIEKKKCYICGSEYEYPEVSFLEESSNLKKKIETLEKEKVEIKELKKELKRERDNLKKQLAKIEEKIKEKRYINEAEKEDLNEKTFSLYDIELKLDIIKKLKELEDLDNIEKEEKIVKSLISKIKFFRKKESDYKINNFISEFENQARKIGIDSLNKIEITDKLTIFFYKNGEKESFDSLSSGEQLRIKISFYLTWLKLALEKKEIRHPAFLMIDSPGKEETNDNDLEELSEIFYNLNLEKEKFQIIICSAKNLPNATTPEKIKEYKGFLF